MSSPQQIVGQPQATATVTLVQRKPNNYIGLSVFTLLCCCWLFGIIALIFALQVRERGREGGKM